MRQTSRRPKASMQIVDVRLWVRRGETKPCFLLEELKKDGAKGLVCMQIQGKRCYAKELDKDGVSFWQVFLSWTKRAYLYADDENMRRVGLSCKRWYANVEVPIWDQREGPLPRRGPFCAQVFWWTMVLCRSKETTNPQWKEMLLGKCGAFNNQRRTGFHF